MAVMHATSMDIQIERQYINNQSKFNYIFQKLTSGLRLNNQSAVQIALSE